MPATDTELAPNEMNLQGSHTDAKELQNFTAVSAQGEIKRRMHFTATVDFASAADGVGETIQITGCNGVALGDIVSVSLEVDMQDMILTGYVQAANIVEVRLQNESTATVDLASTTLHIIVEDVT